MKLQPKDPLALVGLAKLAANAKDTVTAGHYVQQALATAPENPQAWVTKGDLAFAARDFAGAEADYEKVLGFEHGMHAYLKDKHAALLDKIEKNGAKWDNKPAKDSDSEDKKAFKKLCIDAEAELTAAIEAFKKSFA